MRATFLLSKDPGCQSTGDLTLSKLVMELASASYDTRAICLSPQPRCTSGGYQRIAKPAPQAAPILIESLKRRRSLVHTRFVFDELINAVDRAESDIFVADHSYMAEAVLRSRRFAEQRSGPSILAVNTVVPEALVWRATRGLIGRADCRRIVRDEIRVARQAYSVGTYDLAEAQSYRRLGINRAHWLDVTLPPKQRVPVADSSPRLVFLGDRSWAPNQEAYETLLRLWPRIAQGIGEARLYIVGAPGRKSKAHPLPAGVVDLGFVDDLEGFLASCRALVAPIRTGGGVRVKILDSASRGLPVVGTTAAIGSLRQVLDIEPVDDDAHIVEQCRRYLLDRDAAAQASDALYEKNSARWRGEKPHTSVQNWLKP